MDRRPNYKRLLLQTGISLLLAAIALGLLAPGISLVPQEEPSPVEAQMVESIRPLELGQEEQGQSAILVPMGEKPRPTDPLPTRPEQDEQQDVTIPTQGGNQSEGNDDGFQGPVRDGEAAQLAMVLKWYQYGGREQALSCQPMSSVSDTVNLSQLPETLFRYELSPQGPDADRLQVLHVTLAQGDAAAKAVDAAGQQTLSIPDGSSGRRYTFRVTAQIWNEETQQQEQVDFTFFLNCINAPDLNLQLTWKRGDGTEQTVSCLPGGTERISVRNTQLENDAFLYSVALTGALADDARITDGAYAVASGRVSGGLEDRSGVLRLSTNLESDRETYYLIYTAQAAGQSYTYRFQLDYLETLDVSLYFKWRGKGGVEQILTCEPDKTAVLPLRTTQLSAGGIGYKLELSQGRILNAAYISEYAGAGTLDVDSGGSLPLAVPQGQTSNVYTITVNALVSSRTFTFTIRLELRSDVTAQMTYSVAGEQRILLCEKDGKAPAEDIYDDELTDDRLEYSFSLVGQEQGGLTLSSVSLYQSATGRRSPVEPSGTVVLLQRDGKRGWNDFTVTAQGENGESAVFTFRIPYKHRGENTVQIETNLMDGQTVTIGTDVNLTVTAWSENSAGEKDYIPAVGTDTRLTVTLDGEEITYTGSSGNSWEYILHPGNLEIGDERDYTLTIYAEDSYGNWNEVTYTLHGRRADAGQEVGKTAIYVDMTVLGIGVVGPVYYDVLANEPVSYTVAKVALGLDTGMPFGAASDTFGWQGSYGGTLDVGFYLQSLTTDLQANALEDERWPGGTEEEVLDAIDRRFGKRTGLATLWRCLYRNGLNKSGGSGTRYGEFDYTSGSGWMYSIGGTYYPGQSMSKVHLKDGDILTLRYTLAYGWDISGGADGYGNTVGYCVTALNGAFSINHQYETVANEDGTTAYRCRCCGIVEECQHQQLAYWDQGDGTHVCHCLECGATLGEPEPHRWNGDSADSYNHICLDCGCTEQHLWQRIEGTGTASCTQGGTVQARCVECGAVQELEEAPLGHAWDNRWNFTAQGHFRRCSRCGEESDRGEHVYVFDPNWWDFVCTICGAHHDMDFDACIDQKLLVSATCLELIYECQGCGYILTQLGVFDEYHQWTQWETDGSEEAIEFRSCVLCGAVQTRQ